MSDQVAAARAFAIAAHGNQKYAGQPYVVHLDAVADLLKPYGEAAQTIGYLHDVGEDTMTGIDTIRSFFGDHVADCVALVTDPSGATRADRKTKAHAKLSSVAGVLEMALIVKAADRLANLRQSQSDAAPSKIEMYRNEHPAFRAAAYRPGLCDPLWTEIDAILRT